MKESLPEPNLFLHGSSTRTNELLVNLRLPAPSVSIHVPYDTFATTRGATAFAHDEIVVLVGNGLGMNDYVAQRIPPTTLWSGPNGVPVVGVPAWPNALTVARSDTLAAASKPVGRLLFQTGDVLSGIKVNTFEYTPGCSLKTASGSAAASPSYVRFGVNDTVTDVQRLKGIRAAPGYILRLVFITALGDKATPCKAVEGGRHGL